MLIDEPDGHAGRCMTLDEFRNARFDFGGILDGGRGEKLNFAPALAGSTVFAPSPWYPPKMPLISQVGRTQRRSSVE